MKKFIIGVVFVIIISLFCACSSDDTVTYYKDYNGNGSYDFGEGVYYEDSSGTHFLD